MLTFSKKKKKIFLFIFSVFALREVKFVSHSLEAFKQWKCLDYSNTSIFTHFHCSKASRELAINILSVNVIQILLYVTHRHQKNKIIIIKHIFFSKMLTIFKTSTGLRGRFFSRKLHFWCQNRIQHVWMHLKPRER